MRQCVANGRLICTGPQSGNHAENGELLDERFSAKADHASGESGDADGRCIHIAALEAVRPVVTQVGRVLPIAA